MTNEELAKSIAATANECCHRSDGYEEAIQKLVLAALQDAYKRGADSIRNSPDYSYREDMGR